MVRNGFGPPTVVLGKHRTTPDVVAKNRSSRLPKANRSSLQTPALSSGGHPPDLLPANAEYLWCIWPRDVRTLTFFANSWCHGFP